MILVRLKDDILTGEMIEFLVENIGQTSSETDYYRIVDITSLDDEPLEIEEWEVIQHISIFGEFEFDKYVAFNTKHERIAVEFKLRFG